MATNHQLKNNVAGTVQNNPLSSGGTNLQTDATSDTKMSTMTFPFYITIWGANLNPNNDANMEIVEVTARASAQNYTINRGTQGTTGVSHVQNSNFAILWTTGNSNEAIPQGTTSQGSVYYIGSDNLPHLLAPGANGQFLTTGGAGANPTWTLPVVVTGNFGTGSDGSATCDGTTSVAGMTLSGGNYTMTRDVYFINLTINGGVTVNTAQFRVFCQGTISGTGTLAIPGKNGGNASNASGNTGGAGGAAGAQLPAGYFPAGATSGAGGRGQDNNTTNGTNGGNGSATNPSIGSSGVAGSTAGTTGGSAGTATATVQKFGFIKFLCIMLLDLSGTTFSTILGSGGSGGAGGGFGSTGGASPGGGGGGGGSGTPGGTLYLACGVWAGTFTIDVHGGTGGNGGTGVAGGGSAGSGATGGISVVIYGSKSWTGSYNLAGGSAGSIGTGGETNGNAGNAGNAGNSYELSVTSLL